MIEIGSKWQHTRTNNKYKVTDIQKSIYKEDENTVRQVVCIYYKDQQGETYVRTEKHFLDSFKLVEPKKKTIVLETWLVWSTRSDCYYTIEGERSYIEDKVSIDDGDKLLSTREI